MCEDDLDVDRVVEVDPAHERDRVGLDAAAPAAQTTVDRRLDQGVLDRDPVVIDDVDGTGAGIDGREHGPACIANGAVGAFRDTVGVEKPEPDGRTRVVVPQGLTGPYGITSDHRGTVYAADHFSLAKITDRSEVVDVVTGSLPVFVRGVAADGDVLQLTTTTGEVHAYDPTSKAARLRASGLKGLSGIAVTRQGRAVVAEADAGRVVLIDEFDTATALAEGLDHPAGVAVDDHGTCYATENRLGQVVRLDEGKPVIVSDHLGRPRGLAFLDEDLVTIDVERRRLLRISLATGRVTVEAEDLPVDRYAGIAAAVDGSLLISADGEGSVLRLTRNPVPPQENQ